MRVDDAKKSGSPAAMLDVRPAGFTNCRHVKAVARRYELRFLSPKRVMIGPGFHALRAAEIALLRFHNSGCNRNFKILFCHISRPGLCRADSDDAQLDLSLGRCNGENLTIISCLGSAS